MSTIDKIKAYLNGAIASFVVDPPSTKYQQGYRAALSELQAYINKEEYNAKD